MCTPWDPPSVDRLADYGVDGIKVASADMTNHTLLRHMATKGIPLVVSTGMATEAEIRETVDLLRSSGAGFALLHCQSTYPAPYKDVNLRYLERLAEIGQCPVGYSGHERGIHVPIAAVALGAKIVEKHFTTDRELEGNDHKVSLLPGEFAEMVQRVREVEDVAGQQRTALGVHRRDDEPGQPGQEPDRRRAGSRSARRSPTRPSTSSPRAAGCSPTRSNGWSAAPPAGRSTRATSSTPPTSARASPRAATTRSGGRGACRCATTTSRR